MKALIKKLLTPLPMDVYPRIVSLVIVIAALPVGMYLNAQRTYYQALARGIVSDEIYDGYLPLVLIIGAFVITISIFLSILKRTFEKR